MPGYRLCLGSSRTALFSGLVVIFSLAAGLAFGQHPDHAIVIAPDPTSGNVAQSRPLKRGEAVVHLRQGGQSLGQYSIEAKGPDSPDDAVNIIVEFREEPGGLPLAARQPLSLAQAVERQTRRQVRIRSIGDEILQLENRVRSQRGLTSAIRSQVVRHEFGLLFNGLSATVRRSTLPSIEQLPEVRRVWPDREVNAYLDRSVPLIGSDRAGAELGLTGQGITVAVVDSGVDYTHPDLGAGFGPGFKVVGGYDAYNKDEDPMDDYGHGTHVAGIIAANGGVRGVAPDARILAVKVLGAGGSGAWSAVIAGVEWAVKNGAQVINMSLGGVGTPDDPVSQAVDSAVEAGVLVVVAAGNSGPAFYTLGSPGMARQALTVGAVDTSDKLARFSSRGPAPDTFQIKPEIVAPGVGIRSTVPRGSCGGCDPSGYRRANGTSMASPHVAGAAALLLQAHAGWTPVQVRAALMAGSRHLDLHTFAQGNGRLDVFAAASATTNVSQANFSLGLDDLSGPVFFSSGSLVVVNSSSAPVSYSATIDGHFPAGATLLLSPSQFVLGPGQSQPVDFQVQVDNLLVPSASEYPCDYSGGVLLHEGEKAFRLPFSFLKGAILDIDSGEEGQDGLVIVHGPRLELVFERHTHHRRVVVPDGRYDLVSLYGGLTPALVIKEEMESSGRKTIQVTRDEAAHIVRIDTVLQDGSLAADPSQPSISLAVLRHGSSDLYLGIGVGPAAAVYLWSDMSSKYVLDFSVLLSPSAGQPGYIFMQGITDGINHSRVLRNTPADLRGITLRHGLADAGKQFVSAHLLHDGRAGAGPVTRPGVAPFQEEWRLMAEPRTDFAGGYLVIRAYSEDTGPENFLYSTSLLRLSKSAVAIGTYSENGILPYRTVAASDWPCGIGPSHWDGQFENEPGTVAISLPGESTWFRSQTGDNRREGTITFRLLAGDAEVASGPLSPSVEIPVSPGRYRFETASNFLAGDARPVVITADFDTGRNDSNPPRLLNLQLLSHGVAVDAVPPEGAEMGVRAGDDQAVAAISAFVDSGTGWVELPGRFEGNGWYFVTFPPLRSGAAELRFRFIITDSAGNTLSYESSAPVIEPDLSLQASHRGKLTSSGELEYLLTVTGLGRTPAGGPITVIDELPSGMAFVSAEGTGWSCAPQAGEASRIRCTRNTAVPPGGASTIVLKVKASQSALPVSVNRATLVCGDDSILSNDSAVDVVSGREGDGWHALGPDGGPIRSLAVTRGPGPVVYAASDRLLFKSTNRGETWTSCASPVEGEYMALLAVHPDNDRLLYAASGYNLFRSRDGARSWQAISSTIFTLTPRINHLVIDPVNQSIVYMTQGGLVFKSTDGGETWFPTTPALESPKIESLAIAPSRPEVVYAGGPNSVWKTSDAGSTWSKLAETGSLCLAVHPLDSETVYIGSSTGGVSRSTDGGGTWQHLNPGLGNVSTLVVDTAADKSVRIVALIAGFITRSIDGGQSWGTLGSNADYQTATSLAATQDDLFLGSPRGVFHFAPASGGWQFTSHGLFAARISALARDSEGATYAATEQGLMVWRGNAWQLMPGTENHGPVRLVVVDPTDSRVIYLVSSALYRTTDGGAAWVTASDNLKGVVNSLTFHPANSSIVFAATTEGIFKSTDRGSTWINLSSNLPSNLPSFMLSVTKVAVDPKNPSRLFLARADHLYRSTDSGGSWAPLIAPGLLGTREVAIDPNDSEVIYAIGPGGFFRSTDGGDHWAQSSSGLAGFALGISALQIDPRSPSILYIATFDGVYASADQGASWHPLNAALPGGSANLIAIDANAPGTLWVATFAGLYFADLRPDVLVIKGHQGSLVAGRLSSYTLTVANTGDEATTGTVTVTDSLPAELTFVSASAPGWNTGVDGKSIRFSRVDPMPPHSTREITLQVEVSSAASGVCTNVASLSVDFDRDTADNFASIASNVVSGAIYAYPFVTGGEGKFTGLALANYGETEAAVQLTAFGQDGSPLPFFGNPAVLSIPARSQLAALASELFDVNSDATQLGWIELWSSHPLGNIFQVGGAASLDGGSVLSQPAKTLFFTRLMDGGLFQGRTGRTTVSLVNLGFQPVTVELRLIKDANPAATLRTISIPARGCTYASPTEWFGDPMPEADYLRADVTQGDGLVGFEMIDANEPQATIILPAATGDPGVALGGQTLFSAQLAASHGFYTRVKLVNTATESRRITLRATGDIGQLLADPVVADLPAGASFDQDAATLFQWTSTERIGSLRAEANGAGIIGDVLFGDIDAGTTAAALPLQTQLMTEAVFGHVANGLGFFTGLAVLNPGQVETDVTIQVFASDGRQTGETLRRLAAGVRLVGLVTELMPETTGQIGGYVRLVSTQPIVAQELFGNGNILSAVIPTIVR
ncbi:MAG: DUF11 domain-containing protein [Acidobacteria bacterium]|nr:MAG: DUF11 domain-containing protein [Acidobacteriota bacterium]